MLDNAQKARGDMKPLSNRTYVEHLSQFLTEQNTNLEFETKKAIIICQRDYSLTRLLDCNGCKSLTDMPISNQDIQVVTHSAMGMGISEKDIIFIEDWSCSEMNQAFQQVTKEFMEIGAQGKRSFLYVYCMGKGVLEKQQYFILNSIQENLFNIEQSCVNVCKQTKNMCTVFTVYDMKKDFLIRYPGLQRNNIQLPLPSEEADK